MDVIISHKADMDGIASAALLARREIRAGLPFMVFLRDYEDEESLVDGTLSNLSGQNVIIVDISAEQRRFEELLQRFSAPGGFTIDWIDHHPISDANRAALALPGIKLQIDPSEPAAASMVYGRFYRKGEDHIADVLLSYAIQADTWKLADDEAKKLVDMVAYYNYLDSKNPGRPHLLGLVFHLAMAKSEPLLGPEYQVQLNLYKELQSSALSGLPETVKRRRVGKYDLLFALSPDMISGTIAADAIMKKNKADIVIVIKESGGISFRRTRDDVDLSSLASLFGGGGHSYAAGARADLDTVDTAGYEELVKRMSDRMKEKLSD